jgi:uncharacterized protein YecE (DUF72 family)
VKPVRIGCSGWNYKDWRGVVYPEGLPARRWLERYAELFDTVEVNNTFYRLPSEKAVAHWVEQTPDGFLFTVKASRYLTHIKRLADAPEKGFALAEGIKRFYAPLEPLRQAGKLGPVLWQLPGNFKRDDARLAAALELLPEGRHCFEFRHPSWFTAPVYRLLGEHDAALVIADDPERPFTSREVTASWTFVRLHRGSHGRRGNYSDAELATWRRRIAGWRARIDVFAYLNNDWEAFAPRNALTLSGRRPKFA